MAVIMRSILLCFTSLLLAACASSSSSPAEQTIRHYRGVVLDADSRTPVAGVNLTACHEFFSLNPDGGSSEVGTAQSQKDGSFDLIVPATSGRVTSIAAQAGMPWRRQHPHKGDLPIVDGILYRVSDHHENVVLVRQTRHY